MIKKAIKLSFMLIFMAAIGVRTAHANGSPVWVTGKVVSVVENQDSGLVSLELPDGELVSITSRHDLLEGIQIGDIVTIQVVEGMAQIIQVAESVTPATPAPEKKDKGVQWVPGEVVSIERGATDSMLSIKMSDGTVFNVAVYNNKIEGISVGDQVIAKVYQGWAESVTKK
jgi:molybdopterin-binding protein